MNILAIDYSSTERSVAVARATGRAREWTIAEAVETGGRAANTFALTDSALNQAGIEREQIDRIVIGLGPGSYTGIRAAISVAQGWQFATGVRLTGISSAECIAAGAADLGLDGRVAVVIDAQRGEFYIGEFELRHGCSPRELRPLRIASHEEVLQTGSEGALLIGPEAPAGLATFRTVLPRAGVLARMGFDRSDCAAAEALTPIYLRETTFVKHRQ